MTFFFVVVENQGLKMNESKVKGRASEKKSTFSISVYYARLLLSVQVITGLYVAEDPLSGVRVTQS